VSSTTIDTDALRFTQEREQDGKLAITLHLGAGQTFKRSIFIVESEQRSALVNEICDEFPGLDREWVRGELLKLARKAKIDLRWDVSRKINGTAPASARLWSGSRVVETVSLNLLDPKKRNAAVVYLAPFVAGKGASRKKLEAAARELHAIFKDKLQEVLTAPTPQQQRIMFDPNQPEEIPYEIVDGVGILWRKKLAGGGEHQKMLTNWTAKILANVVRSDGVESTRLLEMEGGLRGKQPHPFLVPAEDFKDLKWVILELGGEAFIDEELEGTERRVKVAIQKLSKPVEKRVYTHTGWIKRDGVWQYLHAGGAITPAGLTAVDVSLDGPLARYRLPEPPAGAGLIACIRASLKILQLAQPEVVYPAYCAIWRSILGRCDYTVSLVGPSGAGKSELLALTAQHFGAEMTRLALVANWNGTHNGLMELAYLAKDALLHIDEFKLHGNSTDEKQKRKADDMIQGIGNGAGKPRMKAAGGLWADRPARSTLISSGEQVPGTKSCIARQLITEVGPKALDFDKLTNCQNDGIQGLYAGVTAAYLQWLAQEDRIEQTRLRLKEIFPSLRAQAAASALHKRTPNTVADLYAGLLFFLEFAREKGAITAGEQKEFQDAAWAALGRVAEQQRQWLESGDPAVRYLELLEAALASGEAHLAALDGGRPGAVDPTDLDEDVAVGNQLSTACGWWREAPASAMWHRQGLLIGYLTHEGIALLPDPTLKVIRRSAGNGGDGPVGNERDLRKRLHERGVLIVEQGQKFQRLTVRRVLGGRLQTVLLLRLSALSLPCARNARNDPDAEAATSVFEAGTGVKS
jgi:hypothetical protein